MEAEKRLELFGDVLSLIKSTEMLNFAKIVLINADDYFFTMPASTTGKYHPSFALGDGGLVRHTKAVTMCAYTIADSLGFDDLHKDAIVIAAIAHDIKKKGNGGSAYTTKDHPVCAYNYLWAQPHGNIDESLFTEIANAVRAHMGRWGEYPPQTPFEKALQAADLIASKKWFNLNFDEMPAAPTNISQDISHVFTQPSAPANNINESSIKNENESVTNPGDIKLWFGKHKGLTVAELCSKDREYAMWMVENFNNPDLVKAIREQLVIATNNDLPF